jgi:hypothetical protein
VAQFRPTEKTGNGSMAASAAATSVPTSIVPVLSTVRETITGTSRFIASSTPKQETSAILTCSRSWHVSTIRRSAPASTSALACSAKTAAMGSKAMWPSDGSFVVGPMEPATYAGPPCRRIASRALPTAARLISATRSASPYSERTIALAPKVFVSSTVAPAERKEACHSRITSGPETLRNSLHPSRPSQADGGISIRCRFVPQAPSKNRMFSSRIAIAPPSISAQS